MSAFVRVLGISPLKKRVSIYIINDCHSRHGHSSFLPPFFPLARFVHLPNFLLPSSFEPLPHRSASNQRARQEPETCVCGGPTSTVSAPTTVVTLPSMPIIVQVAPPCDSMWETLNGLPAMAYVRHARCSGRLFHISITIRRRDIVDWYLGRNDWLEDGPGDILI